MVFILSAVKFVVVDILGSIIYFPIWWYTRGTKRAAGLIFRNISNAEKALAIGILFRYFFKPMYADYTKSGRAISLVVRFVHLLVMLAVLALVTLANLLLLVGWLVLLPATIYIVFLNSQGL
ncbi:MAG: hypothetical protein PHH01_01180 [Patescibacteria group bacterium]|nr:hypothetical protein [Patescibacteria group bacterium]